MKYIASIIYRLSNWAELKWNKKDHMKSIRVCACVWVQYVSHDTVLYILIYELGNIHRRVLLITRCNVCGAHQCCDLSACYTFRIELHLAVRLFIHTRCKKTRIATADRTSQLLIIILAVKQQNRSDEIRCYGSYASKWLSWSVVAIQVGRVFFQRV